MVATRSFRSIISAVSAAGALFLATPVAQAAGVAGTVTFVKGTAESAQTVAGPFQPVKRGTKVVEGEILKTGPDSRVELKFADGSVMRLAQGTTLQLGRAVSSRPGMPQEVTLSSGLLWARISKAAGGDSRFAIKTHNAVAGVRGTVLQTFVAADGSTLTLVFEGQVGVTNALGAFEKILDSGKGNQVLPDGTVLDATDLKEILAKADAITGGDWAAFNAERDVAKDVLEEGKEGAAPKDEGMKVRDDISKLGPQDMVAKSELALTEMRNALKASVDLVAQARKAKDIVRLNCLNERVTQMKGVLKVAEDANVALAEAAGSGDVDGARGQYTKVAMAQERVGQLKVQAQNCVGAESYYGGDTEVVTDINPALAGGDPFFSDRTVGTSPRDDYANGPKNPVDNTDPNIVVPPSSSTFRSPGGP